MTDTREPLPDRLRVEAAAIAPAGPHVTAAMKAMFDAAHAISTLTAERDALRAEVEALRDDARRMDWLDAEISGDPGGRRIMCLPGGLRAAIDAASQKEQQG